MSARTKALLKRLGAVEKAVSRRYGGDSVDLLAKYMRLASELPKDGDFVVASDDEITALAEVRGVEPERLKFYIELRNKIIRDDDC